MARPIRVLHVEDNDFFAIVAAAELESTDVTVERVERAERALDRLDGERFDCVLSDYELPGMDGLELLDAVRADHPELPFILLTGGGSEEVASDAITGGVNDYFRKRAGVEQFDTLANRIENAVARRRAERAVEKQTTLNDLLWDLGQGLLEVSSREEIEQLVCDGLTNSELYRYACIGEYDRASETVVPRAVPDDSSGFDTPGENILHQRATATVSRAIRSKDVVVTTGADGLRLAVVPLVYEGAAYGAVNVYADRWQAFEGTERQTLSKFGNSVAYAIDSVKTRHALSRREQRIQVLNRVLRHNLRNDMTVILGYAENLIEEFSAEGPGADARMIKRKAMEVTEVSAKASEVTETLERATEARKPVELTGSIERKVAEFAERFPQASISHETPDSAWVDADFTITAAIEEMIENAIVHNDHDSPTVHVVVSRLDSEVVGRIRVAVEDNGPQIPATERSVLVEGQETALHHSSGLGLWLVNWIVDKFGGDITFEDNQPRGNVVSVELGSTRPSEVAEVERAGSVDDVS